MSFVTKQVLRFLETKRRDQLFIVRSVVRDHKSWRRVKSIDQQPPLVVETGISRSSHVRHAPFTKPPACGLEQQVACLDIIHALEKAKEAALFVVLTIVCMIDDRH